MILYAKTARYTALKSVCGLLQLNTFPVTCFSSNNIFVVSCVNFTLWKGPSLDTLLSIGILSRNQTAAFWFHSWCVNSESFGVTSYYEYEYQRKILICIHKPKLFVACLEQRHKFHSNLEISERKETKHTTEKGIYGNRFMWISCKFAEICYKQCSLSDIVSRMIYPQNHNYVILVNQGVI